MNDTVNKLQQLSKLFDAGIITKEELEAEKAIIFGATSERASRKLTFSGLPKKWLSIAAVTILGLGILTTVIILATRKSPETLCKQGVAYVYGKGVTKNVDKGLSMLKKAAGKGNAVAMREVARVLTGQKKIKEGLIWYDKAILAGDAASAIYLGKAYMLGNDFFKQDYTKAVKYNTAAISLDKTNVKPYLYLGFCYLTGKGVKLDYSKAFEYYQRAANLNSPEGIYYLALCYENGYGVSYNHDTAVNYFKKAADLGNEKAIDYINELRRQEREKEIRAKEAYDNQLVPCPQCHGSGRTRGGGFQVGQIVSCGICGGSGYVTRRDWDFWTGLKSLF